MTNTFSLWHQKQYHERDFSKAFYLVIMAPWGSGGSRFCVLIVFKILGTYTCIYNPYGDQTFQFNVASLKSFLPGRAFTRLSNFIMHLSLVWLAWYLLYVLYLWRSVRINVSGASNLIAYWRWIISSRLLFDQKWQPQVGFRKWHMCSVCGWWDYPPCAECVRALFSLLSSLFSLLSSFSFLFFSHLIFSHRVLVPVRKYPDGPWIY